MRASVLTCDVDCVPQRDNPPEESRTYSSVYGNSATGTAWARSMLEGPGTWSPATNQVGEWMQIDLGESKTVHGVETQGYVQQTQNHWVTGFYVSTSVDGVTFVQDPQLFPGNSDMDTVVSHTLSQSVTARYIRFIVQSWNEYPSMRASVLTCEDDDCDVDDQGASTVETRLTMPGVTADNFAEHQSAIDGGLSAVTGVGTCNILTSIPASTGRRRKLDDGAEVLAVFTTPTSSAGSLASLISSPEFVTQ